ncbi:hypothetical protein STEG23_014135 [Scotinomys teguina]
MCRLSWFLDPGGWSKTAAVGLYFIFPGICTLSLELTLDSSEGVCDAFKSSTMFSHEWSFDFDCGNMAEFRQKPHPQELYLLKEGYGLLPKS